MGIASKKCVSTIATRLGWTGWLLVLVYFGALTAISDISLTGFYSPRN